MDGPFEPLGELSGVQAFTVVRSKNKKKRRGGSAGASIILSGATISEGASVGDLVGTLSVIGISGTFTYSLLLNPGGLFAIVGDSLEVAASLSAGSDVIVVLADDGAGTILAGLFTIVVTRSLVGYVPTYELLGF